MSKLWGRDWFKIIILSLVWQMLILLVAVLVFHFSPLRYTPSYPLAEVLQDSHLPLGLARLGGFDGVHYYSLVYHRGYQTIGGLQAFFPLYPLLMSIIHFVVSDILACGLIVSSLSLTGYLCLAHRWANEHFSRSTAWWFTMINLTLPASFFLLTVYTESLFLFLLVATFYAYDHKNYSLAAFLGILLSACRLVGVVAVAALCLDYLFKAWQAKRFNQGKTWAELVLLALGSSGLLAYMTLLWVKFQDPLSFMKVQADFAAGRDAEHLILLPQVFFRYARMIAAGFNGWHVAYYTWQELLLSLLYLVTLIVPFVILFRHKKLTIPLYLLLYSLGTYLIPPATGTLGSMPRYLLTCLAVPVILAQFFTQKRHFGFIFCLVGLIFCIFNLTLFLSGWWVS